MEGRKRLSLWKKRNESTRRPAQQWKRAKPCRVLYKVTAEGMQSMHTNLGSCKVDVLEALIHIPDRVRMR